MYGNIFACFVVYASCVFTTPCKITCMHAAYGHVHVAPKLMRIKGDIFLSCVHYFIVFLHEYVFICMSSTLDTAK